MTVPLSIFSINLLSEDLLLFISVLVFFSILVSRMGTKLGMPSLLLFLLIGMLAGTDGLGLKFNNFEIAVPLGNFAMTVILFTGGLETSLSDIKPVMIPGLLLSSVGVLLTSLISGLFIYYVTGSMIGGIGTSFVGCFLLASVMGSTDSASVFSILRGRHINLREKLGPLLELESGSNDPMAYVLTIILVQLLGSGMESMTSWGALLYATKTLALQIVIGFAVGLAVGYGTKLVIERVTLVTNSLYSILILCVGFFANGLASFLEGNGLLAIYVAAIIIGNKVDLPQRRDIDKFMDGMTWLMQLLMFLMLGLLARPSHMLTVAGPAIQIGIFMIFIARPVSVFLCMLPFKEFSTKAKLLVSWVGLKGAGPILFAIFPVVAGLDGSSVIFNIVFFITLLSLLFQGVTIPFVAKNLDLYYEEEPQVQTFGMEIPEEMGMLRDHTVCSDDLLGGSTLRDLNLPHGIRVMMVRRGDHFLVPHGSMELYEGDHLVIIMGESDDDLA